MALTAGLSLLAVLRPGARGGSAWPRPQACIFLECLIENCVGGGYGTFSFTKGRTNKQERNEHQLPPAQLLWHLPGSSFPPGAAWLREQGFRTVTVASGLGPVHPELLALKSCVILGRQLHLSVLLGSVSNYPRSRSGGGGGDGRILGEADGRAYRSVQRQGEVLTAPPLTLMRATGPL